MYQLFDQNSIERTSPLTSFQILQLLNTGQSEAHNSDSEDAPEPQSGLTCYDGTHYLLLATDTFRTTTLHMCQTAAHANGYITAAQIQRCFPNYATCAIVSKQGSTRFVADVQYVQYVHYVQYCMYSMYNMYVYLRLYACTYVRMYDCKLYLVPSN